MVSIEVEDHQHLKQIEDDISDLLLCLESTLDTVSTFQDMYDQFRVHHDDTDTDKCARQSLAHETDAVIFALREKTKEVAYTRKKAEALLSKVINTRTLVCLTIPCLTLLKYHSSVLMKLSLDFLSVRETERPQY